jgi:hypothetical protein
MILTGNRILIQLDAHPDHTVTASGVYVPHLALMESDGGKLNTVISNVRHLARGTVQLISPFASKKLEEEGTPLKIGDRVQVPDSVVSPNYQFFKDKDGIVLDFEGLVVVPHTLIEAILNNE